MKKKEHVKNSTLENNVAINPTKNRGISPSIFSKLRVPSTSLNLQICPQANNPHSTCLLFQSLNLINAF